MATDAFLEFDPGCNIKGESKDSQHGEGKGDCLQVISYAFGTVRPASVTMGQGLGSGKLDFEPFTFKVPASKASHACYKNMCLGTHIPVAKLFLRKSGGGSDTGQKDFLVYTFKELMITKYATDGGSEDPTDDIAFAYTSLHVEYKVQDAKGETKRAGSWGYDLKANKGAE